MMLVASSALFGNSSKEHEQAEHLQESIITLIDTSEAELRKMRFALLSFNFFDCDCDDDSKNRKSLISNEFQSKVLRISQNSDKDKISQLTRYKLEILTYYSIEMQQLRRAIYNHSNYISKWEPVKESLGSRIKIYSRDQIYYVLLLITTSNNNYNYNNIAIGSDAINLICKFVGNVCGVECSYCKTLVSIDDSSAEFARRVKNYWTFENQTVLCTNCAMKSNKDFHVLPQKHYGSVAAFSRFGSNRPDFY